MRAAEKVKLVPVGLCQALLGIETYGVTTLVESGQLRWVWDFAHPSCQFRRALRFYFPEVLHFHDGRSDVVSMEEVIADVIGPTPGGRQRSALMEIRWCMSPQLVRSMVDNGQLDGPIEGHTRYLTRVSMEKFLRSRLNESALHLGMGRPGSRGGALR